MFFRRKNIVYSKFVNNPLIVAPTFQPLKSSWSQYDLDFPNLTPRSTESHIYLFLNIKTKRFYINQTDISRLNDRLKEHRQDIARKALIQIEKQQYYTPDVYDDIARDAINDSSNFFIQ